MLTAVEFDGQVQLCAVEVEDVGRAGVLAAEFEVGEAAVTEVVPEQAFAIGLLVAQVFGEGAQGFGFVATFRAAAASKPMQIKPPRPLGERVGVRGRFQTHRQP